MEKAKKVHLYLHPAPLFPEFIFDREEKSIRKLIILSSRSFLCVVLFFSLDCHHFRKPTKWSFYGECAFPSLFFPFRYCASSIVLHFHLQFCTQNIEKTYNCIILEMESLSRLKSQRVSMSLCMSTFSYFFSVANAFVFNYYTFFKYSP